MLGRIFHATSHWNELSAVTIHKKAIARAAHTDRSLAKTTCTKATPTEDAPAKQLPASVKYEVNENIWNTILHDVSVDLKSMPRVVLTNTSDQLLQELAIAHR